MVGHRHGLTAVLCMTSVSVLNAHDLGAEVRLQDEYLEVRAFFDDGTWARGARVQLLQVDNRQLVAEARSDKDGRAQLPRPAPGKYILRVNAGAGHVHEEQITVPPKNNNSPPSARATDLTNTEEQNLISSGLRYQDRTRFPWYKLALGLLALGTIALVAWWSLRGQSAHPAPKSDTDSP